jgi:tetratricopeptide (TPR) repeat protein
MIDAPLDHGGGDDAREERWYLSDERDFLERSLEDADREHAAGDLSDEDHAVLTERDRQRLATVVRALEAMGPESEAARPTKRADSLRSADWRRVGIIAACFMIIAGVVILVDHALSPRLPGQVTSGGITLSKEQLIEQQLNQATALDNGGQVVSALKLYNDVLAEDPDDPDALAASGWVDWNYGTEGDSPTLLVRGRQDEEKAISVAPDFYQGHMFLGLILLYQDHNAKAAVIQFNQFLADQPPASVVKSVASLVRVAYTDEGVPVPPSLAAAAG